MWHQWQRKCLKPFAAALCHHHLLHPVTRPVSGGRIWKRILRCHLSKLGANEMKGFSLSLTVGIEHFTSFSGKSNICGKGKSLLESCTLQLPTLMINFMLYSQILYLALKFAKCKYNFLWQCFKTMLIANKFECLSLVRHFKPILIFVRRQEFTSVEHLRGAPI
jgi:hypothetical protein